jgi:NAD(P)H dehydrogenase (quinone)
MLVVTAGGSQSHHGPRGIDGPIDDLLFPIDHGVLLYPGYEVPSPFVVYQADRLSEHGSRATSDRLRDRMRTLFTSKANPCRRQNGGGYAVPAMELREEVVDPTLAGFTAHRRR